MKICSKEKSATIVAACEEHQDLSTHQLARILYEKNPQLFASVEDARSAIRYRRGKKGVLHRARASVTHPELLQATMPPTGTTVWEFPKSKAPSYAPVYLDSERILVLSDIHIPFHSPEAVHAAINHGTKLDPTCVLLNGDTCDFFSISRFDKNPTISRLKKEIDQTRAFLGWLRQKFPKARIIFKPGNHDEWFDQYIWKKAPELFGVKGVDMQHLTTAKIDSIDEVPGIEWIKDQRKIMVGHLSIWHGHEIGKGSIAPPVNPARGLFMRTMECGLMGHLHKDSTHTETTSNGKLIACWSTGCLCGLWPYYARVNKWTHSAAFVRLERGKFRVEPIRIRNGEVL